MHQSLQTIIATRCSTIYLRDRFSFLRAYRMFVPSAVVLPPADAKLLHLLSGNTRGHGHASFDDIWLGTSHNHPDEL